MKNKENVKKNKTNAAPTIVATVSKTPVAPQVIVKEPEEPKEVILVNEPRVIQAYWHKACKDIKKSTKTTLKVEEHLRLTDGKVEILINDVPTQTSVYSLKRGNRIYYLYDVTPSDIVKAEKVAKEKLANATVTV